MACARVRAARSARHRQCVQPDGRNAYGRHRRVARFEARRRQRVLLRSPEALCRRRLVAAKEVVIGFGHPVYTVVDPRHNIIKEVARQLSRDTGAMKMFEIADRIETVMA